MLKSPTIDASWRPLTFTATDGLRLHARDYGSPASPHLPVLCLPGLTRTSADFHELACALAMDPDRPRRVLAVDYRGRGRSDYDPDPAHYDLLIESADIQALLTVCDIGRAAMVGTSRGGLHIMALSAARPTAIAAAVLNDIGPVVEMGGLMRIKGYVGRIAPPSSLEEAAATLEALSGARFPAFGKPDWLRLADRSFVAENGRLRADYDPALTRALETITPDQPPPALWPLFDGLARVPLMVIRGETSDILSIETLQAMQERRPDMATMTVPGQGHAPMLWDEATIAGIARFIAKAEANEAPR